MLHICYFFDRLRLFKFAARILFVIKSILRFIDMTGSRRHFGSSYCKNLHWLSPDLAFSSRAVLLSMSTSSLSIAESQIGKDAKQLSQAVEYLKACDPESKLYLMETVDVVLTVTGASQIKVTCPRILLSMGWEPKISMQPNGVRHSSVNKNGVVDWDLKLKQYSVNQKVSMSWDLKFKKLKGAKTSSSSSSSSGAKKFCKKGKFARSVSAMKKVQKFKKRALGNKKKMKFMMKKMKFMMMKKVGTPMKKK